MGLTYPGDWRRDDWRAQVAGRRFTVSEYRALGTAGILWEDDRVELIGGEIIEMAPITPLHASRVNMLTALFVGRVGEGAIVSVQNPLQLDDWSEPMPDVALLRPRLDWYASALPTAADSLLVIEVSDLSLEYDRTVKLPLYAQAGVVEVWIASLTENHIEVYTQPENGAYTRAHRAGHGETLMPTTLPDLRVAVDAVLV